MKIVVNRGRTLHIVVKPAVRKDSDAAGEARWHRPETRACGPGTLLDLPDDEARNLIARGFATKYESSRPPPPEAA
jgi:hypothetical protein